MNNPFEIGCLYRVNVSNHFFIKPERYLIRPNKRKKPFTQSITDWSNVYHVFKNPNCLLGQIVVYLGEEILYDVYQYVTPTVYGVNETNHKFLYRDTIVYYPGAWKNSFGCFEKIEET